MLVPIFYGSKYGYQYEVETGHYLLFDTESKTHAYLQGDDARSFTRAYERSECGARAISEFCIILNIDCDKLYQLVKAIIKWHEKREWMACFPFTEKNNATILEYIQAS